MKDFKSYCNTDSFVQNYECQVVRNGIAFDACLWQELFWLWEQGIETIGCCCGHHVNCSPYMAYIQVRPKYEQNMVDLGYEPCTNEFGVVLFKPKTVIIRGE